jgi:transcriptional regulator with XRE-family HTH domain
MAKKFGELRARMAPDRQKRNEARADELLTAMSLSEIRDALDITQEEMAERLRVAQSSVSRVERREDMLLSTLREFVNALGGELQVVATFPNGAVRLKQFEHAA